MRASARRSAAACALGRVWLWIWYRSRHVEVALSELLIDRRVVRFFLSPHSKTPSSQSNDHSFYLTFDIHASPRPCGRGRRRGDGGRRRLRQVPVPAPQGLQARLWSRSCSWTNRTASPGHATQPESTAGAQPTISAEASATHDRRCQQGQCLGCPHERPVRCSCSHHVRCICVKIPPACCMPGCTPHISPMRLGIRVE